MSKAAKLPQGTYPNNLSAMMRKYSKASDNVVFRSRWTRDFFESLMNGSRDMSPVHARTLAGIIGCTPEELLIPRIIPNAVVSSSIVATGFTSSELDILRDLVERESDFLFRTGRYSTADVVNSILAKIGRHATTSNVDEVVVDTRPGLVPAKTKRPIMSQGRKNYMATFQKPMALSKPFSISELADVISTLHSGAMSVPEAAHTLNRPVQEIMRLKVTFGNLWARFEKGTLDTPKVHEILVARAPNAPWRYLLGHPVPA